METSGGMMRHTGTNRYLGNNARLAARNGDAFDGLHVGVEMSGTRENIAKGREQADDIWVITCRYNTDRLLCERKTRTKKGQK